MSTIRILPIVTVNRIAAGEVVERAASVVKELVENAIDAGATAVDIHIQDAGRTLIAVTDNGRGMSKEELALSVLRHATSKLPDDDLLNIHHLGFRVRDPEQLGQQIAYFHERGVDVIQRAS